MGSIISFEDFQKRSKKSLKEDTIIPTGNSTVFTHDQEDDQDDHHEGEKNYMFFKNLYTMKRCIDEIMAMDKEQVDELIEKGHDWASDHISSSKDDLQEVCDWLRYEIDNHEEEYDDDDEVEVDDIEIETGDDDEDDDEDDDGDDDGDDEDDEDDEDGEDGEYTIPEALEEEEDTSESKEPKYSYSEEKN